MFKFVLVNFFQKRFDSIYRGFLFYWNQGSRWKHLKNRIQWRLYPNLKKVSAFPIHLDIETTARCNLRCPMCANRYVTDEKYRNYGDMDLTLFKKIVDECAENNLFSIRLSWRGEVFANPRFTEYVRYAKIKKKIPQISFLTNGIGLKGDVAKSMIDLSVDYISVSVDGMDDIYEKIRYPARFKDIYRNLSEFIELRKSMGKKKPLVRISTLWPAIGADPDAYYKRMSKVCDKIVYNPLKDYAITEQDREGFTICQFLWERLFISFDGLAHPCSNTKDEFIIGDVKKDTVKAIWHNQKMNELRRMHLEGRRLEIFPCMECSYGVNYEKRWKGRDWSKWDPKELLPKDKN